MSTDTYRQATNLFKDFDGVHFSPHLNELPPLRRFSLSKPPLASQPHAFEKPPDGQNMVYYPAPVPMMLNLPQRLSKKPVQSDHEKRRTQLMKSIMAEARKSGTGPPATVTDRAAGLRRSKVASDLPPHLRASAFFEPPPAHLDIEVKQNSAVATLDSILDAAARAPVVAFTDHPIVGHVGAEVYGKPKPKRISRNMKKRRSSAKPSGLRDSFPTSRGHIRVVSSDDRTEGNPAEVCEEATPSRASYEAAGSETRRPSDPNNRDEAVRGGRDDCEAERDSEGEEDEADEEGDEEEEEEEEETYVGPPTTLLAELQMRKQEQKQRNRTAATAFPNGMHSTLLELDAVAQLQRKARKQRPITLAWEDPEPADRLEQDDDDVPLAILFPGKNSLADENRPLGLMEKLELEENESLSRRRARLRGEPSVARNSRPFKRTSTAYTLDVPFLPEEDNDDDENETLAERVKRLKARDNAVAASSASFADGLLSQLGCKPDDNANNEAAQGPEEETLGQRRKRLQAEAQARAAESSNSKSRRSMADILQAHPARVAETGTQPVLHPALHPSRPDHRLLLSGNRSSAVMMHLSGGTAAQQNGRPIDLPSYYLPSSAPYRNSMKYPVTYNPTDAVEFGAGTGYGYDTALAQQTGLIDPNQRAMIDRWRQSVRQ
jgi:hypothetical protein